MTATPFDPCVRCYMDMERTKSRTSSSETSSATCAMARGKITSSRVRNFIVIALFEFGL